MSVWRPGAGSAASCSTTICFGSRLAALLLIAVAAATVPAAYGAGSDLERRHRERAEVLMREARWYDAALQWEVVRLLRPDRSEYTRKMEEAREQAREAAIQRARTAAEARRRNDLQRATQLYLAALNEDPEYVEAAVALREIEREQLSRANARTFAHLSEGDGSGVATAPRRGATPSAAERRDLESAIILLHQGDYEASVKALEQYLRRYPSERLARGALRQAYAGLGQERFAQGKKEEALTYLQKAQGGKQMRAGEARGTVQSLRKQIAQDYYERGVRAQRADLNESILLLEQALQYNPELTQARVRLEQTRRMRDNLNSLDSGKRKP